MAASKVLTMCQGGNSRSVGCAYLLKYEYGFDALACGWEKNSSETITMLCKWADWIMVMEPQFKDYVPVQYHGKIAVVDVGPDRWFNSLHPELLDLCNKLLQQFLVAVPVEAKC